MEYIDDEAFLGCTGLRKIIIRSRHIKDDRWFPDERGYIPNDSQNSQFAGIRMI